MDVIVLCVGEGEGEPPPPFAAYVAPRVVQALGATMCDYVRLSSDDAGTTLVKLLMRTTEPMWPDDSAKPKVLVDDGQSLLVGRDVVEALGVTPGATVRARRVAAAAIRPWRDISLRLATGVKAPSMIELCSDLRPRAVTHPWRSDCSGAFPLLPRRGVLELGTHRGVDTLRCEAVCGRDDVEADAEAADLDDWGVLTPDTHVRVISKGDEAAPALLSPSRPTDAPAGALLQAMLAPRSAGGVAAGVPLPSGPSILLCGPPGSGKTFLIRSVCAALSLPLVRATPWELAIRGASDPAHAMKDLLHRALRCRPSVVCIEGVDQLAPADDVTTSSTSSVPSVIEPARLTAVFEAVRALRTLHTRRAAAAPDGMSPGTWGAVSLIATAVSPRSVHSSLTRQFDLILELGSLSATERSLMFERAGAGRGLPSPLAANLIRQLTRATPGYLPADIDAVCDEAKLRMRVASGTADSDVIASVWRASVSAVVPSRLLDLASSGAPSAAASTELAVSWSGVRGHGRIKRRLEQLVLWPMRQPEAAARLGLGGSKGVLLYGPPGTGKTLLVRCLAAEAGLSLVSASIPQLLLPSVGASEKAVSDLFARAREHAPCVLLLDELQALFGRRDGGSGLSSGGGGGGLGSTGRQMLSQLLVEMDALCNIGGDGSIDPVPVGSDAAGTSTAPPSAVVLIGVTNAPHALDPALLRAGRLEHALYMPPPSARARQHLLTDHLRRMPLDCEAGDVGDAALAWAGTLAERTDGFTGADVASLCQKAALAALQRQGWGDATDDAADGSSAFGSTRVSMSDFLVALEQTSPSVTSEMLASLDAWRAF